MSSIDPSRMLLDENPERDARLTALSLVNFVLRHRRLLSAMTAIGLVAGMVLTMSQSPWYEASVKFVTSPGSGRAVAGESEPTEQGNPFDYYSTVLSSSNVLDAVLKAKTTEGVTVLDRLATPTDPPGNRLEIGRRRLAAAGAKLTSTHRARENVMPVLVVSAGWTDRWMAANLANAFVDALADFDKAIRSTTARNRRLFIESQIEQTSKALKMAERDLGSFREKNRLSTSADLGPGSVRVMIPPQLEMVREQLQREVNLQRDLYVTLKTAFEQARIAELNEASPLVIIEPASPPSSQSGRSRRNRVMFLGFVGFIVGLGLGALSELRTRADLSSPDGQEFVGHLGDIHRDFTRLGAKTVRALAAPKSGSEHPEPRHDA